ncbi:hypothetical protein B0J13DRAFT_320001 [Dactylonectria estremocensis]|uniref:Uncharacterized protein n=1 Tax=Dactylonectria estremocensis TaxID=1079267 RepID=A0A9P9J8E7_9HYPO|nr:hypothetical protein B0J13DRAFT_320001 [Dactylonectria estremocensis]
MPREEPVRVPIDEIRRTLEDLDGRRTRNGAGGRSGPPHSIIPSSLAYQSTHQPRQEPVRVPLDEVRRTLEDLDRRHAKGRTPRRQGESRQTEAKLREEPVRVPLDEIRQRLDDLDRRTTSSKTIYMSPKHIQDDRGIQRKMHGDSSQNCQIPIKSPSERT